jgi:YVTN family beta-propeller protein
VTPINTATNRAGSRIKVGPRPDGIAFSPNGKTAYVLNDSIRDSITPIDVATSKPGKTIFLGDLDELGMIAADPNGKTLYFLDKVIDTVTPIQVQTGTVGKPIPLPRGAGTMVITPDGKTLYVASQFANSVTPIRTTTNTKLASIKVGPSPVAMIFGP